MDEPPCLHRQPKLKNYLGAVGVAAGVAGADGVAAGVAGAVEVEEEVAGVAVSLFGASAAFSPQAVNANAATSVAISRRT